MSHSHYSDVLGKAVQVLTQMHHILEITEKHMAEKGISDAILLDYRLAPDMFPLSRQIQSVSDNAKGIASRLSGAENPSMPDTETTMAELKTRIEKTLEFVKSVTLMDDAAIEALEISFPWLPGKAIGGHDYLAKFAVGNLFFHFSMAYAILRTNGVIIGKSDFMGDLPFYDKA